MKVLVVSNGFPPRGNWGTEFYTRELVLGLRARGHEVEVMHPLRSTVGRGVELEQVEEEGVPITLLHVREQRRKRFEDSYRNRRVEELFEAELERIRPEIVHFTYLRWGLSVHLPAAARRAGAATVLTLTDYGLLCHRGQMFDHRLQRCFGPHPPEICAHCIREPLAVDHAPAARLLRLAAVRTLAAFGGLGRVVVAADLERRELEVRRGLEGVDHFIAPTGVLAQAFESYGIPAQRLTRLVYSFDTSAYEEARSIAPSEPPIFGFLAQFAPHKGLATLVDAAALLAERRPELPWEVRLYGGSSSSRFRRYAPAVLRDADPRRVRLVEPFTHGEAPRVFAALSALVLPAEWDENAPLSILQARAIGLPILGSDVPGIREVVEDASNSRLFAPGDAAALADAMELVLDGELARCADPAMPFVHDEHLERVEELYTRLARERGEA